MRYTNLALRAVVEGPARVLVNIGRATHAAKGANFVNSLHLINGYLDENPAPFIAKVYLRREGVKPWFCADDYQPAIPRGRRRVKGG